MIKTVAALVGGALSFFLGGWDVLIQVLIAFVVIDFVTGVIAGGIAGQLSSSIGFKGIGKKMLILILVGVSAYLDRLVGQPVFRSMVCMFYIVNESLSILENLGRAGVAYPAKLKSAIEMLNKKDDK
jgi:toxin secretion/phage lysis holin